VTARRVYWGYLRDIREAIQAARQFEAGMSFEQLEDDRKTMFATTRALEIVGEAARRIPPEVREGDTSIPWRRMTELRNIITHEYDRIDLPVIWDVVHNELPGIAPRIAHLEQAQRRREEGDESEQSDRDTEL
jgi:uncharacterized protein with HEPN domain